MCDTFVATRTATADGSVIVGKNSDRDPNEAHEVVLVPAADHAPGARVAATYVEVPQVARTHAVLLAKPFWIWGAEMGVNEHGVVIGNEAVFTRVPHESEPGLIGMDLLRLGLERAATAREAVEVVVSLLARHGQSGDCGFTHPMRYHNSFLVADRDEAWVLETAGREWGASRVEGYASISNALTLSSPELASPGLVDDAVRRGWCRPEDELDFARTYSDRVYTRFSDSRRRQCRTEAALAAAAGSMDVPTAMRVLRDHGDVGPGWSPARGLLGQDVCAHAGFGPVRISQTTGSMVVHLADGLTTTWVTATAATCTSVFRPVWFAGGLPEEPSPTGRYDPATLWWRHEDLHRETLRDYPGRHGHYVAARDALEAEFVRLAEKGASGTAADRAEVTASCFAAADAAEQTWLREVRALPAADRGLHARAWRHHDEQAGRP